MRIKARDPHFAQDYTIESKDEQKTLEGKPVTTVIKNSEHITWVPVTLAMRAKLLLYGKCSLGMRTKPGWTGYLEFFLVKCSRCKEYFIDYPHGHKRYFWCPRCDQQYSAI